MSIFKKTVFFDASVLFSALYSSLGGSSTLVKQVKKGSIRGITSQTVIDELRENVSKLKHINQGMIDRFIVDNNFIVRDCISSEEIHPWIGKVEEKDIHVVVGALSTDCAYLVTLDKKHLNNKKIQHLCKGIQIGSPKELLIVIKSSR